MATKTDSADASGAGLASSGGGRKFDSGKPDLSLNPPVALREMAKAFGFGAWKYDAYNFEAGLSARRLLAAAQRHIADVLDGKELDDDPYTKDGVTRTSGAHQLGHALASLAMYLRCRELGTLKDDRSPNRPALVPVLLEAEAAPTPDPCLFSLVHQGTENGVMRFRAYNFPDRLRHNLTIEVGAKSIESYSRPEGTRHTCFLPGTDRKYDNEEIVLCQTDGWSFDLVAQVVAAVRAKAAELE